MTARHSTGVAEPVPAVDDDLLRHVGVRISWVAAERTPAHTPADIARLVLNSPAGQGLRAAWTADTAQVERQACVDRIATFIGRQRADTDLAYLGGLDAAVLLVEHEDFKGHAIPSQTGPVTAVTVGGNVTEYRPPSAEQLLEIALRRRDQVMAERDAALAEVERLRAAVPDIPDVGPVTRHPLHEGAVVVAGETYGASGALTADYWRSRAAQVLAVAAFLDREAEKPLAQWELGLLASSPTDAELEAAQDVLEGEGLVWSDDLALDFLRKLDEARARAHGEDA